MTRLSPAQFNYLRRAAAGYANWGARANAGGSIRRMVERLVRDGYMSGPPFEITDKGRAAAQESK
jgi:hypothetical protein